jgi:hypothetical protein
MPRLLVCRKCQTVEELPLYDGPAELEAQDPMLDGMVRRHVQKHGDLEPDAAALLVASEDLCHCPKHRGSGATLWEGHRDEVLGNLKERWTGFHPEFYATKDTYREDALKCYTAHRRPKGTDCVDWRSDHKRLTPENWKGREVYLCDFCPVASTVTTEMRHKRGMYKREPGEVD